MALTQILTTDSVSASVVNTKIVDKANADISGLQIAQTAGGTGTAITLTGIELTNGYQKTFVISASNSGAATTINGKPLYKPGGTVAPNLTAGKAATVWYNLAGDCFFIKASAEGTAVAGDVLATKTFSNDNDTGLTGTLALTGTAVAGDILATKTAYNTNPKTQVTGTMPNRGAVTITPGTTNQAIAAGYHNGSGYVTGDADLIAANILAGKNVFGVDGTAKRSASGIATGSPGPLTAYYANDVPVSSYYFTVAGLTFKPSKIIAYLQDTDASSHATVVTFIENTPIVTDYPLGVISISAGYKQSSATSEMSNYKLDGASFYVTSTGFRMPAYWNGQTIAWFAFE